MGAINLYLGDCMEAMKSMEENQYDLAIVDPPYGIGDFNQSKSKKHHKDIFWNDDIPSSGYFMLLDVAARNKIVWGVNYYPGMINDVGRIIHIKDPHNRQVKEISTCDIASHSFGKNIKHYSYEWRGNVQGGSINWLNEGHNSRNHPCQKPVELYEWLLMNYAKPGQKILDTHGGSMSIALAVHNVNEREGMNLSLDLWEIDEDYYNAGVARYENHIRQKTIFS